ncbi:MAG: translocation/assembly module TamB domain-containing protein [Salinisphaera sp.]|nr:translocation/assembly module TamB domain-containing protein [Salinisphaera sp.]
MIRRWSKRLGVVLVVVVAMLAGATWLVAGTETGLRWGWALARRALPAGVTVASVEGRLLGPLTLHGVVIDTESARLRIDSLRLAWSPSALLERRLMVDALHADGVVLQLLDPGAEPKAEPATPLTLPQAVKLPLRVVVHDLSVTDFRLLRSTPETDPLRVDRLFLAAVLKPDVWRVKALTVDGPLIQLTAQAVLHPQQQYALAASANWSVTAPGMAPVAGRTRVSGGKRRLVIHQSLAAPYSVQALAIVSQPLTKPRLDVSLHMQQTRLAAIRADLPPASVSALLHLQGPLKALELRGHVHAQDAQFGAADLRLEAALKENRLVLERVRLTTPAGNGGLTASGQLSLQPGMPMDIALRWNDLQWPLTGQPVARSAAGTVQLQGSLDAWQLTAGLDWAAPGTGAIGRLELAGRGDLQSVRLQRLALTGAAGTLSGKGSVTWAPRIAAELALQGRHINPGALLRDWPGDLAVAVKARASIGAHGVRAHVPRATVDGSLRKRPLHLALRGGYKQNHLLLQPLTLRSGDNQLSASGQLAPAGMRIDLQWTLDAPALAAILPDVAGRLSSHGHIGGSLTEPVLQAKLEAAGLSYAGNAAESLTLAAEIDASGEHRSQLRLSASGLAVGDNRVDSLRLQGGGFPQEHSLTLTAQGPALQAQLQLQGSLGERAGQFTLADHGLTYGEFPPVALVAPVQGRIGAAAQHLQRACLRAADAMLCLQGARGQDGAHARFTLENLQLGLLEPWLPPDLRVSGAVSAQGELALQQGRPRADIRISTSAIDLASQNGDGVTTALLALAPGDATLRLRNQELAVDARLPLAQPDQGALTVELQAGSPAAGLMHGPLRGHIRLQVPRLDFVSRVVPEISKIDASLSGNLRLDGELAAPVIDGHIALTAQRLDLATPGLSLRDVSIRLSGEGERVAIEASASSGQGRLQAGGWLAFADDGPRLSLAVAGEKFQVMDTADARVFVSPDLHIEMTADQIAVTGQVTVPQAAITLQRLPQGGGVTVSDDQVIVTDSNRGMSRAARSLFAQIEVILGEDVHFEGFGLTTGISGQMIVNQRPGEPTAASGALEFVDGAYRAYGQDLSIRSGRLVFSGPVTKPAVNIVAVRTPDPDILVGVKVYGPIRSPRVTVFSEPPMGQSEQLSWLLLGRPLEGNSDAQASLITRMALALGVKGGNSLAQSLGSALGIDDISIDSAPGAGARQAALMVGEYLTPRLYVSYSMGLFEPISILRLRYTLSPLWRVQAESSGVAAGGDLLFSIERP